MGVDQYKIALPIKVLLPIGMHLIEVALAQAIFVRTVCFINPFPFRIQHPLRPRKVHHDVRFELEY